jgi:SNF2 family DNA or RNA helicase
LWNSLLKKSQFNFLPYQKEGIDWCIENEKKNDSIDNVKGGIIADEMGLGKTFTLIATMFLNMLSRTLIVLPPILLEQWKKEIYKCTGHRCLIYYGNYKKDFDPSSLKSGCIVLTTYHSLRPLKGGRCPLLSVYWDRIIFDEAHHLRNPKTKRFQTCYLLKARIRWLVSGTPVQNKMKDFYSLCKMLRFRTGSYTNEERRNVLKEEFILRRTKAGVGIELPSCVEHVVPIQWKSESEKQLSEQIHSLLPKCSRVTRVQKLGKIAAYIGQSLTLTRLLRARQMCIMPHLVTDSVSKKLVISNTNLKSDVQCETQSKMASVIQFILERKDNGCGKVIFCHFQKEIDVIADCLERGGVKRIVVFDGRNNNEEMRATISDSADVLILQMQTGCEGLNLQKHFSEIYFVSPNWNPSIEDQAIARCYRMGQTKEVHVFRFTMKGFERDVLQDENPIALDGYIRKSQFAKRKIYREILED